MHASLTETMRMQEVFFESLKRNARAHDRDKVETRRMQVSFCESLKRNAKSVHEAHGGNKVETRRMQAVLQ